MMVEGKVVSFEQNTQPVQAYMIYIDYKTVPWPRWLAAGLSPQRSRFAPKPVHVGFVLDKVALGQVSL
jgi:hypothetical protein